MDGSTRAPHPPTADCEAYERQLTMNRPRRRKRLALENAEEREARLSTHGELVEGSVSVASELPNSERHATSWREFVQGGVWHRRLPNSRRNACVEAVRDEHGKPRKHAKHVLQAMLQRRALESPENREPRLHQLWSSQRQRLAAETREVGLSLLSLSLSLSLCLSSFFTPCIWVGSLLLANNAYNKLVDYTHQVL